MKSKKVKTIYEQEKETLVRNFKTCDRCGNDLTNGNYFIHLPFKKEYIKLCNICNFGLMYGFYRDIKKLNEE